VHSLEAKVLHHPAITQVQSLEAKLSHHPAITQVQSLEAKMFHHPAKQVMVRLTTRPSTALKP
jgi:hypothetical protein